MARKRQNLRREITPDYKYQNELISRFIGKLMLDGKKSLAERMFYDAIEDAGKRAEMGPEEVFELAMKNVSPVVEVRSRRVGGSTYQVPMEVSARRRSQLAIRWVVDAARAKQGKPMTVSLADELLAASHEEGDAIKKREDIHRMAEANRAFAHFARF